MAGEGSGWPSTDWRSIAVQRVGSILRMAAAAWLMKAW